VSALCCRLVALSAFVTSLEEASAGSDQGVDLLPLAAALLPACMLPGIIAGFCSNLIPSKPASLGLALGTLLVMSVLTLLKCAAGGVTESLWAAAMAALGGSVVKRVWRLLGQLSLPAPVVSKKCDSPQELQPAVAATSKRPDFAYPLQVRDAPTHHSGWASEGSPQSSHSSTSSVPTGIVGWPQSGAHMYMAQPSPAPSSAASTVGYVCNPALPHPLFQHTPLLGLDGTSKQLPTSSSSSMHRGWSSGVQLASLCLAALAAVSTAHALAGVEAVQQNPHKPPSFMVPCDLQGMRPRWHLDP